MYLLNKTLGTNIKNYILYSVSRENGNVLHTLTELQSVHQAMKFPLRNPQFIKMTDWCVSRPHRSRT